MTECFSPKYFDINWTWLQNVNHLKPIPVRVKHQQVLRTSSQKIMPSTWEAEHLAYTETTESVDLNGRRCDCSDIQDSVQVLTRKKRMVTSSA